MAPHMSHTPHMSSSSRGGVAHGVARGFHAWHCMLLSLVVSVTILLYANLSTFSSVDAATAGGRGGDSAARSRMTQADPSSLYTSTTAAATAAAATAAAAAVPLAPWRAPDPASIPKGLYSGNAHVIETGGEVCSFRSNVITPLALYIHTHTSPPSILNRGRVLTSSSTMRCGTRDPHYPHCHHCRSLAPVLISSSPHTHTRAASLPPCRPGVGTAATMYRRTLSSPRITLAFHSLL